nr:cytochrome b6/f subunit L [Cathaya argyrophylla]ULF47481.1 cytochrome b6/f subunit L [Cathaya argyrophylla]ULF47509.1 cytochrome b6/f subunit L [Cathaya argyrophylla]ULF47572.1 cytochrome b6/f subunit L [Cathaya argyrophylla]
MSTIISYFGFLLASIILTLVLFISSSKIQLIQNETFSVHYFNFNN